MKINDMIILIPAYQPDSKLIKLVDQLKECFLHIIIVDDGSNNNCKAIFEDIKSEKVVVLKHEQNKGKGRALKTGFEYIITNEDLKQKKGIITVDADGQHQLSDICNVAQEIDDNNIVLGVRAFGANTPFRSKIGNEITKIMFRLVLNISIRDTQTGLRGIPMACVAKMLNIKGERYEYETNMLLALKSMQLGITQITIQTIYIEGNKASHFNPVKDSFKIYKCIFKYISSSIGAFLIDNIMFILLLSVGSNILVSMVGARSISLIVNYIINKKIVFKDSENNKSFIKYFLLVIINILLVSSGIKYFAHIFKGLEIIIKIILETFMYIINFYVQKKIIFKV